METPRILKSPILVDEKRLQVGYKEDDIRAFLPRSVRNVEMQKHVCVQLYKHQGWEQLPVLFYFVLFKNLFKPRQHRLAVGMVTDFVSSIHNLKTVF